MEYVILDNLLRINGEILGTEIKVLDITDNIANVVVSNTESEIHSVVIVNGDPETCIKVYFDSISDKDIGK